MIQDEERTQSNASPSSGRLNDDDARKSLLDLEPEAAAKRAFQMWDEQTKALKKRHLEWRVNALRREGYTQVSLVKARDTKSWAVYLPPGDMPVVPSVNKAERLVRRLRALIFSDAPLPEATPDNDSDDDRDAAEFATRALIDLESEGTLDGAMKASQAFDTASTYDSGFVWYTIDANGGGRKPMQVQAHPMATSVADAVRQPTGVPWPENELVTRYVALDGNALTDDVAQAKLRWLPKLKSRVMDSRHVRFWPADALDIWDAELCLIAEVVSLLRVKGAFPEVAQMGDEDLAKLVDVDNEDAKELAPAFAKKMSFNSGKEVKDDSPVFILTVYAKQNAALYPDGFYGVFAGGADAPLVLHRGKWVDPQRPTEVLDIPITQYKQFDRGRDPYGLGAMAIVGGGNEIRATMFGVMLEHLARFLARKVFYPVTSTFQPKAAQAAMGTYIPINAGGAPVVEQVPDFPKAAQVMFDAVSTEMDEDLGLSPIVSGQNPAGVQSGLHAQQLIEQVYIGLSDCKQNTERALIRGWRIILQQVRAFYTVPQRIAWEEDDGAYKEREWTGADFGSTRDVRIRKGSFTMLAPSAKLAIAEHLLALQAIDQEDLRRLTIGTVSGTTGLQDDPTRMRIRRQLQAWTAGPQGVVDPASMTAAAQAIFLPQPGDDEPTVAPIRHREIRRTLQSVKASRWPEPWRAPLLAEYERMRQAAGVVTIAEQQAAAKAEADAQAQAAGQAQQQADAKEQQAAMEKRREETVQVGLKLEQGKQRQAPREPPVALAERGTQHGGPPMVPPEPGPIAQG